MARSKGGIRSKARGKLTKRVRERGISPVSRVVQIFEPGRKVVLLIDPGFHKGQPHPRYHGRSGVVRERTGRAYVVELREGGTIKKIITRPEHLRAVKR